MGEAVWTSELRQWLKQEARAAGFDASNVAAVRDPDDPAATREAERFAGWVEAGRAGEMEYLKRRNGGWNAGS